MLLYLGKITDFMLHSVNNINGHSSQICQDYYILEDRKQDVINARQVMQIQNGDTSFESFDKTWDQPEVHEYNIWGRNHPDFGKPNLKRARWTATEIEYIGDIANELKILGTNNIISRCLKRLKSDPKARDIFHENHVLDSARLRSGYDAYLKQKA